MKDIAGKELRLGDSIAFNPPRYKGIVLGNIVGFTPKMVKIEYFSSNGLGGHDVDGKDHRIRWTYWSPSQVAIV